MPLSDSDQPGSARLATSAILGILLLAAVLRVWGVLHDLPFSYYGDELHFMRRAMAMGTGDLNPHWFHKPAFLMYLLAFCYGVYFALGMLTGRFESTAQFGASFLFEPGPFLLIGRLLVAAAGVATVWVVYRVGRKVFANPWAGVAAGAVAAVLLPMVNSSRTIKSDVPCGLLMALSVWAFLGTRLGTGELPRLRPLVVASLLAGAAMGTHYYGVVLVPAYLALEALKGFSRDVSWGRVLGRCSLVVALFLAGFFLTSPFNFLDPTWGRDTWRSAEKSLGLSKASASTHYDPDSGKEFKPGAQTWGGAAGAFFQLVASSSTLGIALSLLAALGLVATLVRRETRWYGLLVLIPCLFFFLAAITIAAYHAQPRHLNALYPLLATVAWPGALAATRPLRWAGPRARGSQTTAALLLVAAACVPTLIQSIRKDLQVNRPDSRLVAWRWTLENLPKDARILLDDYGPLLNANQQSAVRLAARLRELPPDSPFTHHQGLRVDLLRRYPPPDGFNLDELGHQWWLPREKSDQELRSNETDLDMGNPLVSRQPKPLAEYRREGIRYVITNSLARDQYFTKSPRGAGFPSFVRFYRELDGRRRVRTFDPADWGGNGPVIWIYDLAQPAPPGQRPLPLRVESRPVKDVEDL
ncbi:MAG TPA: glycosyltransferase family 39 protein [Thermoanaerobaculia bacterium]|jgi:4-amino-4-deoxy-L-arabinose transferase-like glycosyltransferase|nr:glycosyltransferase family 39 protein [Thermoanaerobaculia bacterium]